MAHEHEHKEVIMLKNEDGIETAFELVCTLDVDEKTYAILADVDSEEDAIAMRIEGETEEDMTLIPVDDDAEFEAVAQAYDKIDPEDLQTEDE